MKNIKWQQTLSTGRLRIKWDCCDGDGMQANKWIPLEVLWNFRIILKLCDFCVYIDDGSCKYTGLSPITHRTSRNHWKILCCEWPSLRSTRGERSNIFQWDFVLSVSINVCMKCLTRSFLMIFTLLAIFCGKYGSGSFNQDLTVLDPLLKEFINITFQFAQELYKSHGFLLFTKINNILVKEIGSLTNEKCKFQLHVLFMNSLVQLLFWSVQIWKVSSAMKLDVDCWMSEIKIYPHCNFCWKKSIMAHF